MKREKRDYEIREITRKEKEKMSPANMVPSGAGCDEPIGQGQIGEQLETTDTALGALAEVTGRLRDRLRAVLREEPVPGRGEAKEPEVLVPFADTVRWQRHALQNQIGEIQDIISRLEV